MEFMLRKLVEFFGSLKLAVLLLVAITIVLAVATFYESAESTQAVMLRVYRTWWFNGLLALLAVNIAAAALTRWPWKRKHIGFVITHIGLIILLGGCSAAFHYGTEGMMEMHVGEAPGSLVRVEEQALTVVVPETGQRITTALQPGKDGSIKPHTIKVAKDLSVTLDKFLLNSAASMIIKGGGDQPNPALQFRLQSEMAGQNVSQWLLADSPDNSRASLGPAQIQFVVAADDQELKQLTNAPDASATTHPELQIAIGPKSFNFDVQKNMEKVLDLGDTGVGAQILGYWPDFKLDENHKPISVSDQPNNPAAVLILTQGTNEMRAFVFADPGMQPIVRATHGELIDAQVRLVAGQQRPPTGGLTVIADQNGGLHYTAISRTGFTSGSLEVGKPVSPGWMDFQFTVEKFIPNAIVSSEVQEASGDPNNGTPAVAVTIRSGDQTQTQWARFGQPVVAQLGGKMVHLIYGWNVMQLPFTVRLEDFVVERDEGSDNVAGWTSKVAFEDVEKGITQRASIWMNHPAWFEGYKFSQASWNPNDLKYTALQVKKDPQFVTWLTWAGAVLIVAGTAMLFYFRRWFSATKGALGEEEEFVEPEKAENKKVVTV